MSQKRILRIGTRRSHLALSQTTMVAEAICKTDASIEFELVTFETEGDRRKGSLSQAGGKGLFTAELESALREGRVDIAVHSAKDMPSEMDDDLVFAAVPERCDPADVLVSNFTNIMGLPAAATIGTGSPRRAVQLRLLRDDLRIVDIRGNIETRAGRAIGENADLDAVVLAAAGLHRSGLFQEYQDRVFKLETDTMLPAAGQGTLVIQSLAGHTAFTEALTMIHTQDSADAIFAERSIVASLGADCGSSLAVYVRRGSQTGAWNASSMVSQSDGSGMLRMDAEGETAELAADKLLKQLLDAGADSLL